MKTEYKYFKFTKSLPVEGVRDEWVCEKEINNQTSLPCGFVRYKSALGEYAFFPPKWDLLGDYYSMEFLADLAYFLMQVNKELELD